MGECSHNCSTSKRCYECTESDVTMVGAMKTPPVHTDIVMKTVSNSNIVHNGLNAVERSSHTPNCGNCANTIVVNQRALKTEDIKLEIFRNRSEMEAQVIDIASGAILERIPVSWKARENKLDYLSVSKIGAYEQCPACFFGQYLDDETTSEDGSNYYTKFGSILHEVVELAFKYYRDSGIIIDPLSIYNDVWQRNQLTGFDAYDEGKQLVLSYFARNPVQSRPDDPLFIESEWRGEFGGTTFGLIMDYAGVFRDMPNIGLLKDYKTNRMPFTSADLQSSIQLRIYQLVLRRHLAPQIDRWISGYEMFYHKWQQCPEWSMDELLSAEEYVANIWKQISNDNTWEETLNPYCGYRKCRFKCKTYRNFLENASTMIDPIMMPERTDINEIDRQKELMATYEKIAKTRKDDCQVILKTAVEEASKSGKDLVIGGKKLSLYSNGMESYNYNNVRNVLLVNNRLNILDDCMSINKQKLDRKLNMFPDLKQQMENCMDTNYSTPYVVKRKS